MKKISISGICEEITFANFFKEHAKSLRNYLLPEKAKSFLYTVANNTSLNHIAHQKVVLQYAKRNTHVHTDEQHPEFLMEEEQFKVKLQKAIAALTEAQRTAFLLHRIDGKKYHEIAEILGISVKAVEKRIHGALVELRKEIENMR